MSFQRVGNWLQRSSCFTPGNRSDLKQRRHSAELGRTILPSAPFRSARSEAWQVT